MSTARPDGELDGGQLAVLAARLDGIASAMGDAILRSGRSAPVNRARDFSCAIVTAGGDLLVFAESIPIHVLGADLLARSLRELQPVLSRGDAFLHNSPYHGNTHAGDHVILVPVFDDADVHRYTIVCKAHQADIGNSLPTTYHAHARDVYEEGALIFPCVRVQEAYREVGDVVRMCEVRIRLPEQWRGDYLAMVGAARTGERQLAELGTEVGWEALASFDRQWLDYGERRMAAALAALPAASATGLSTHDPLPGTPEEGIPIRSTVRTLPDEGRIEVDLRDNLDNLPCGLNMTEATASAAALIGVYNSLDPSLPKNGGAARRVRVLLREGCVAGIPRHPVSCSVATTNVADRIVNATQQAMAGLADGVGMAEFGAFFVASSAVVSGVDGAGRPHLSQIFLGGTAGAGSPFSDGWLTYLNAVNGGMCHLDSIEVAERFSPLVVHQRRVETDTEGAGRRRGAPSLAVEYGPREGELVVGFVSDGELNPARGVRGGLGPPPAWNVRRRADGSEERLPPSGLVTLALGERVACLAQGGGGYGDPATREPERVRDDVEAGLVSGERAGAVYRVALAADGAVDAAATAALRGAEPARP